MSELSDVDRAAEIVATLARGVATSAEVFEAFAILDRLDADAVRRAFREWTGAETDVEALDEVTRLAHGFPPRRLRLRTTAIVRDADVLDLGGVAEEQLRIAGKTWDGNDLAAEDRLDGENEETSFAGTLEHLTLADAEGGPNAAPRFEVLMYAGTGGVVFRAGTTELVATIADGVVEMKDRRERAAIQEALLTRNDMPAEPAPVAPERPRAPEREREHAPKQLALWELGPGDASADTGEVREDAPGEGVGVTPEKRAAKTKAGGATKKATASKKKAAALAESTPVSATKRAKSSAATSPAKKTAAKKAATDKPVAKKPAAEKIAKKKAAADKPAKKVAAEKIPVTKKASAKQAATVKTPAKKAAAEKIPGAKKASAKKAATAKTPAKKAPAKKTAGKRTKRDA